MRTAHDCPFYMILYEYFYYDILLHFFAFCCQCITIFAFFCSSVHAHWSHWKVG